MFELLDLFPKSPIENAYTGEVLDFINALSYCDRLYQRCLKNTEFGKYLEHFRKQYAAICQRYLEDHNFRTNLLSSAKKNNLCAPLAGHLLAAIGVLQDHNSYKDIAANLGDSVRSQFTFNEVLTTNNKTTSSSTAAAKQSHHAAPQTPITNASPATTTPWYRSPRLIWVLDTVAEYFWSLVASCFPFWSFDDDKVIKNTKKSRPAVQPHPSAATRKEGSSSSTEDDVVILSASSFPPVTHDVTISPTASPTMTSDTIATTPSAPITIASSATTSSTSSLPITASVAATPQSPPSPATSGTTTPAVSALSSSPTAASFATTHRSSPTTIISNTPPLASLSSSASSSPSPPLSRSITPPASPTHSRSRGACISPYSTPAALHPFKIAGTVSPQSPVANTFPSSFGTPKDATPSSAQISTPSSSPTQIGVSPASTVNTFPSFDPPKGDSTTTTSVSPASATITLPSFDTPVEDATVVSSIETPDPSSPYPIYGTPTVATPASGTGSLPEYDTPIGATPTSAQTSELNSPPIYGTPTGEDPSLRRNHHKRRHSSPYLSPSPVVEVIFTNVIEKDGSTGTDLVTFNCKQLAQLRQAHQAKQQQSSRLITAGISSSSTVEGALPPLPHFDENHVRSQSAQAKKSVSSTSGFGKEGVLSFSSPGKEGIFSPSNNSSTRGRRNSITGSPTSPNSYRRER